MKIQIIDEGRDLTLSLPNKMIFSRFVLNKVIGKRRMGKNTELLSPETMKKLTVELEHIKETYGLWELVEVQSASGEHIKVIL